jgi:putative membrane protein
MLYGLIFGFGSPVPGLSAGSLAVILNVYDSFFSSINAAYIKKNWAVTLVFLAGWAVGLVWVSSFFMFLFGSYWEIIIFSFMGMIVGSLPLLFRKATKSTITAGNAGIFVLALVCMLFLAFGGEGMGANNTLEQLGGITPALLAWVFAASFIASAAMLIPGVGGSLMMLVFGVYALYIEAVSTLNPIMLAVFGVSMALGVWVGIVLTQRLLLRFPQALYCAILGLVLGSLAIMYPGLPFDLEGLLSIILFLGFAVFAYWMSAKEKL